jgi:Fe2+ or Zn2+ uptake regulation protein
MKNDAEEEMLRILRVSKGPLTTQEIMHEVKEKCPDASVGILSLLTEKGVVTSEWLPRKGYVWRLPNADGFE